MDDSAHCAGEAKAVKYGIGAEEIYRACMKAHVRRIQTSLPRLRGRLASATAADEAERTTGPAWGPTAARPSHCPRR
jgi:hypothetical protein